MLRQSGSLLSEELKERTALAPQRARIRQINPLQLKPHATEGSISTTTFNISKEECHQFVVILMPHFL
jgi:hypothetical protein